MDWFWQALLMGLLLFWVGMLIFVKSKTVKIVGLVILIGITIFAFIKVISIQQQITTPQNLQKKVISWLNNFQLSSEDKTDDAAYFRYIIKMQSGSKINIVRLKNQKNYVLLQIVLEPDENILKQLSRAQVEELFSQMKIEIARQKINFMVPDKKHKNIYLEKRIPIGAGLTEDVFISAIDEMDSTAAILRETFATVWRRHKFP